MYLFFKEGRPRKVTSTGVIFHNLVSKWRFLTLKVLTTISVEFAELEIFTNTLLILICSQILTYSYCQFHVIFIYWGRRHNLTDFVLLSLVALFFLFYFWLKKQCSHEWQQHMFTYKLTIISPLLESYAEIDEPVPGLCHISSSFVD